MNRICTVGSWRVSLKWVTKTLGLLPLGIAVLSVPAFAQIVPDNTLGSENSQVTPDVNIRGLPGDRIDGGAVRGSSLFHSFSEFNVNNGQRVYFADPAGIANIFSRVTGSNVSNILGTLGVDGAANLFLLNPNGILFGPNAFIDIQGSFVATTGDRFLFPGGVEFGTSNPQAPPVLTMSVPVGVQYGAQPGTITNTGNLTVGQDLTLAGGNLDLQGQLRAGRDLTLFAENTVRARDSAINPFIAAAGGKLVARGNQAVDIVALSHPNSGLFSGGDMVLRSASTVGGDAHYWSGGNFRIETLDGNLGSLFSPADPVIRASRDVSFDSYTGASLHIFAGGSVTIRGDVRITGADTVGNAIADTVTLSDGTPLSINGSTEPTLDIRAGTSAIGIPNSTNLNGSPFTPNPPNIAGTGTSADISINSIDSSGGIIFLTNQYQPNSSLSSPNGITINGSIDINNGGSVVVDSRSGITLNGYTTTFPTSDINGTVTLLAGGDITVNGIVDTSTFSDSSNSSTSDTPKGGDITLSAGGNITLKGDLNASTFNFGSPTNITNPNISAPDQLQGVAGNVLLNAGGDITLNNAGIAAAGEIGGFVQLNSDGDTLIKNSFIDATTKNGGDNNSGAILIRARSLSITENSDLDVASFGQGDAGDIDIKATDTVLIDNSRLFSDVSETNGGEGGNITISAQTVHLSNNANLVSDSNSAGNGPGDISIQARDSVFLSGNSHINSNSNSSKQGANFGTIRIEASNGSVFIDQSQVLAESKLDDQPQGLVPNTDSGFAGDIYIDARDRLEITNNSTISGQGNLGRILIGTNIEPQTVFIENSQLKTDNPDGIGVTGDIELQTGALIMRSNNSLLLPKQRASITSTTPNRTGGDIEITVRDFLLLRNGSYISAAVTQGGAGGDGGTITINAKGGFVIAVPSENSDILASAFGGQGGVIKIDANRVFGLIRQENVNSSRLPSLLTNNTSDINASSDIGLEGSVEINTLQVDPSQGLGELPIDVVDPSSLIARGCGPTGGTTANRQSQFVVTGRGGLPPGPDDLQTPGTTSPGWVTRDGGNASRADIPDELPATASTETLVEAQGMVKTANGELLLTAQSATATPHQSGRSNQFCSPARD